MESIKVSIEDVQETQLEILLEFDKICKKNNINYQLFAGTLLGTIRHNGFIPWDDDIDVCLLRKDYNKFIKVCKDDLDCNYFLQTHETDKNYIMQFAKIRRNDTIFMEKATSECKIHQGIYIDIFPMDNILPDTFLGKFQQKLLYIIGRMNLCRVKMHCLDAKKPVEKYLGIINHYILKIIPKKWTDKLQLKIIGMFKNKDTKYISHLTNGASYDRYKRYTMEKKNFYITIQCEFEGYQFPVPYNYHEVLTRIFNDYMKLPPVEMRKPHHGVIKINLPKK